MSEYAVNQYLPTSGERVMAYGHRTFCCEKDMEEEAKWHEVVFSFEVSEYKLKKHIPEDLEETILEEIVVYENWNFDDEQPFDHLIGVTKWKKLNE